MAERDENRPSGALSSEEADRLSERIKPSWETETDPPTIPKLDPPTPRVVQTQPSLPEANPRDPPKPAPEPAPPPVANPSPNREPAADSPKPGSAAEPPKPQPVPGEAPKAQPLKQTLLGIAAPAPEKPPEPTPHKAPDDLDWEVPGNAPTATQNPASVEPPPKSSPSGIGQTYKPKDTGVPPIVLTEDVQRAEAEARAVLEAEHRSRRAPTLLKVKAVEPVPKSSPPEDLAMLVPARRRVGKWLGLGALALAVALAGVAAVLRTGESPNAQPEAEPKLPAEAEPNTIPAPVPAPPASSEAAPSAPDEPTVSPVPEAASAEPVDAQQKEEAKAFPPATPRPKSTRPVAKPSQGVRAPKSAGTTAKTAAKPAATQKPGSAVIVRDTPF